MGTRGKWQRNIISLSVTRDNEGSVSEIIAIDNDGVAWAFPYWRNNDDELKVWEQIRRLPREKP